MLSLFVCARCCPADRFKLVQFFICRPISQYIASFLRKRKGLKWFSVLFFSSSLLTFSAINKRTFWNDLFLFFELSFEFFRENWTFSNVFGILLLRLENQDFSVLLFFSYSNFFWHEKWATNIEKYRRETYLAEKYVF
jgi:hypothetical protein